MQAELAARWNGDYATALLIVASTVAVAVALLSGFGYEKKDVRFGTEEAETPQGVLHS
jgi:SHS family lactate transporter-like MFS transporter